MRPNQHNKRSRGRSRHRGSSGGGSGGNPLSRVYESSGPDVKVRGTAQTIAEKYLQLGRDAQSSGDNVMSESYFQHAEHYLRILAAAQAYNQQMQQQYRRPGDDLDEEDIDEGVEGESTEEAAAGTQEQPEPAIAGESAAENEMRQPQPQQQNRDFRSRDRDNRDRYGNRPRYDRSRDGQEQPREYQYREQQPREAQPTTRLEQAVSRHAEQPTPEGENAPAAAQAGSTGWEAPSFLRKPSSNGSGRVRHERRPRKESGEPNEVSAGEAPAEPVAAETPQNE